MTCYLIGPVTMGGSLGPESEELRRNVETAELVAAALTAQGYAVTFTHSMARHAAAFHVPVERWVELGKWHAERADRIALIAGWEASAGCRAEVGAARHTVPVVLPPGGGTEWTREAALAVLEELEEEPLTRPRPLPLQGSSIGSIAAMCSLVSELEELRRAELYPGLVAAVRVLRHGREKHGTDAEHWKGQRPDEHVRHALDHVFAARDGEPYEEESGQPHLAHAAIRLLMALTQARALRQGKGRGRTEQEKQPSGC